MSEKLTHLDEQGRLTMVDVGGKPIVHREAVAEGLFIAAKETLKLLEQGQLPKGEALAAARVAGILAAKKCGELIPLCHPLPIDAANITFERANDTTLRIEATVSTTTRTGVEMEALTAVSVAALTLYDMAKAVDKDMRVQGIRLVRKTKASAPQT